MKSKLKTLRIQNKNCGTATRQTKIQRHRVEAKMAQKPKIAKTKLKNLSKIQRWSNFKKNSKQISSSRYKSARLQGQKAIQFEGKVDASF